MRLKHAPIAFPPSEGSPKANEFNYLISRFSAISCRRDLGHITQHIACGGQKFKDKKNRGHQNIVMRMCCSNACWRITRTALDIFSRLLVFVAQFAIFRLTDDDKIPAYAANSFSSTSRIRLPHSYTLVRLDNTHRCLEMGWPGYIKHNIIYIAVISSSQIHR